MPILEVKNLKMFFPVYGGILKKQVAAVHAVNDVSFSLEKGGTLGLVGESGCGKSTLGRAIMRLYKPTAGSIHFKDQDITHYGNNQLKEVRKHMQMVFQDPFASLDPRMTVYNILEEPYRIHKIGTQEERETQIQELLELVGLRPDVIHRYPHEFSGGQRQRIGIARAIALKPSLIIADEPVSALDVSIQSQILNLLKDIQKRMDLTYIFIAHNLAVVKHMSDQIAVMYLGKIIEMGPGKTIYKQTLHPYTRALISAIPTPDPTVKLEREILEGDVPSPIFPPPGCNFHPRCPIKRDICMKEEPPLVAVNDQQKVACHFALNSPGEDQTNKPS